MEKPMWLLTSRLGAHMQSARARLAWSGILASCGHIVRPTYALAIRGFQRLTNKLFGHIWAPPTFLAFALAFAFGFECAFGGRRRLLDRFLVLALVGRWLGSSFGS